MTLVYAMDMFDKQHLANTVDQLLSMNLRQYRIRFRYLYKPLVTLQYHRWQKQVIVVVQ
jgi:hypothetical protein